MPRRRRFPSSLPPPGAGNRRGWNAWPWERTTIFKKPASPDLLLAIVGRVLRRRAEIAAETGGDYLTGLPDRAAFHEMYQKMQALACWDGYPVSGND